MKQIVILTGSPRKQSTSNRLALALADGAAEQGAAVEIIDVTQKKIGYCQGCNYCRSHDGQCRIDDDMASILGKIEQADCVVLATPLYFRSFSAQLKTCIDRFYSRYHARTITGKSGALLVSSGNNSREATEPFLVCYRDLCTLLRWRDSGIVLAGGCGSGDFDLTDTELPAWQEARELGRHLAVAD